jgi:hypothetical protein
LQSVKCHIHLQHMKRNNGKYKEVKQLPDGAMTVSEYAANNEISQSYVYKKIERNKANYEVVIFKTMNFVIPLTKS